MSSISGLTVEIYLFFMLMGWGATRLILPESTRPYQFWIAPWFGLIFVDISVVWFSRLGLETDRSVYLITLLGISLLFLCKLCKVPLLVPLQKFDAIIALGSLIALFLALYPLSAVHSVPTTISLVNADPPLYAIVADYLRSHNINQSPLFNPEHPSTGLITKMLFPGNRTGCWLVLALLASRFNLQTYQIFTITLGVFFALTPPLITIFTWMVTKHRFAAMIALTLSVLNINLLFFYYHGFAAQILAQGCLILAFLWLYLAERGVEPHYYYLFPLGLSISSLFTLYPEMGIFFIMPLALYIGLKLTHKNVKKTNLIINFVLVFAVTALIDPYGFWRGFKYLVIVGSQGADLAIPRWAFPVDMVGMLSIHSGQNYPNLFLLVSSLLILSIIALGFYNWENKPFILSIFICFGGGLVWLRLVREFSYGYYKLIGFFSFAIIIAFSVGLASVVILGHSRFGEYALQFVTLCILGIFSLMAILPTFHTMVDKHLGVTPELASLSEVPTIAKKRRVYLDTPIVWEQLWASSFLEKSRIAFLKLDPYDAPTTAFPVIEKGGLLLTHNNTDNSFLINTDHLPWHNDRYLLTVSGENKISVQLGENWWGLEKWWGDKSDSKGLRWINQDAIIEIKNNESRTLTALLRLKLFPILPKTTLDLYLNNVLIDTLEIKLGLNFYSIYSKLKSGNNQLRFHVREGTIQAPNDPRKISMGVNAIRFSVEK